MIDVRSSYNGTRPGEISEQRSRGRGEPLSMCLRPLCFINKVVNLSSKAVTSIRLDKRADLRCLDRGAELHK